jgi:Transcription factor WhiB
LRQGQGHDEGGIPGRMPWQEPSGPLELAMRPEPWTKRAACRGLATPDFDPWHPGPGQGRYAEAVLPEVMYGAARRVCARCPVRLECALQGLDLLGSSDGVHGMWGGLTPPELRELARSLQLPSRKVAQHGTRAAYVEGCRCPACRRVNAVEEHKRRLAKRYAAAAVAV